MVYSAQPSTSSCFTKQEPFLNLDLDLFHTRFVEKIKIKTRVAFTLFVCTGKVEVSLKPAQEDARTDREACYPSDNAQIQGR